MLVYESPSFGDRLWLLDGTPIPCGQSRETARRSELAGYAAYGWSRSHSRHYWGFRLVLVCAPDGMPIGFELAAANVSERKVAAEILERLPLRGRTILADKGFAGRDFEYTVEQMGGRLLGLTARTSPDATARWEPFATLKGQLSLDRHGARTMPGLMARISTRLLAMAAAIRHNQLAGTWDRSLIAYDH
jgi:hypothetical protein